MMAQVYRFLTLTPSPLPLSLHLYFFSNILCVPAMSKNFISFSTLYVDNPINVLFFDSFFQMQDCQIGVTLVHGQCKDSVYYWPKSVPLQSLALSLSSLAWSSLAYIFMCHSRLGHPSFPKFEEFLSVLSISFLEEHLCSFSYSSYSINKSHKLSFAKSSITSFSPLDVIFFYVWTSPVSSSDGFHYYIIFVDHFTKVYLVLSITS